jgi:signal transduction histidine kinase/ActR/RegA family two-component response regulator
MTVPWLPVIVVDSGGSILTLVLAFFCSWHARQWSRQKPDHIFRNYIYLLTLAIFFFAFSRSFGHLVKQILFWQGQSWLWQAISPYSGAVNSATFIVIFAFGIYFHRFQTIQTELEMYKDNLEILIEQRTAELESKNLDLIESRAVLNNVLNSSIPICITGLDYEVIQANQAYYQLWPESPGRGKRGKCFEQRPGSLCHTGLCPLRQILEGQRNVMIENAKFIAGEERFFIITARPYTGADGQLLGVIESFQDITIWKKAAEERTLLERQLRQAQKMEAIGTMAGGIAHDFNNILTAIIGFSELGQNRARAGEDCGHYFAEVLRAGNRARDLVRHILTFSNRSERTKSYTMIHILVREVLKLIRASTPSTIEIRENIERDCGYIFADPTQIHQVIMNLCTNAVQELEGSGGILSVSLTKAELTADALTDEPEMQPGPYAAIAIADTGRGIPNNIREKIFDPYFTTKPVNKGTGLGLAMARSIVKHHGGAINLQTEPGHGATFTVYLPLLQCLPQPEIAGEESIPTGTERILVVDDEPAIVEVLTHLLRSLGYQVTAAIGSQNALEIFQSGPTGFDLLITDQTMPQMTGLELTRAVTSLRPGLPVILCTGYSRDIDAENAESLGVRGFAMKPVTLREIAMLTRRVLDEPQPPARA